MTTSKDSKPESPRLDDFSENINRAKQEMVLRFVKDQEALQEGQEDRQNPAGYEHQQRSTRGVNGGSLPRPVPEARHR